MNRVTVAEMMTYDMTFVFENETVESVIELLDMSSISGVPVVDSDLKVIGFISEDDIIRACLPSYFNLLQSAAFLPDTNLFISNLKKISKDPIGKYATKPAITVKPTDTLLHVADLIMRKGFKVLPVVDDNGVLLGVLTRLSVIKTAMKRDLVVNGQ
uniref:CBS domain-containing protein n=1 Tax=Fervidobacterium thailandense TaxID=1008305 RepID=A0A7C5VKK8_9BACT